MRRLEWLRSAAGSATQEKVEAGGPDQPADAGARYYAELDTLMRAALSPLAADADAVALVSVVLSTWVVGAIQRTGRSTETAVGLVSDLLTSWLATRVVSP